VVLCFWFSFLYGIRINNYNDINPLYHSTFPTTIETENNANEYGTNSFTHTQCTLIHTHIHPTHIHIHLLYVYMSISFQLVLGTFEANLIWLSFTSILSNTVLSLSPSLSLSLSFALWKLNPNTHKRIPQTHTPITEKKHHLQNEIRRNAKYYGGSHCIHPKNPKTQPNQTTSTTTLQPTTTTITTITTTTTTTAQR